MKIRCDVNSDFAKSAQNTQYLEIQNLNIELEQLSPHVYIYFCSGRSVSVSDIYDRKHIVTVPAKYVTFVDAVNWCIKCIKGKWSKLSKI